MRLSVETDGEKYDFIADQSCPCSLQRQDSPEWD